MERSRSKRSYYYENDYDSEALGRAKPRHNHHHSPGPAAVHRNRGGGGHRQDSSLMVTTSYRILCHDAKAGGVIGKSGSIIKSIRQHTGAWINVHELVSGDSERIIEISDTRRRDPDGRMPAFSPAQEALLLIHERIMESDAYNGGEYEDGGAGNRAVTRLVVSRMHVGSLLGKRGKIIEQMRVETKTQIRILPRDHTLPRCVTMAEEIVQVVGDVNAVKHAISVISHRLRESQHRDRDNFHGRIHSPERFPSDDEFIPHINNSTRRSSGDGTSYGSRPSLTNARSNNYFSRSCGLPPDSEAAPRTDDMQPLDGDELVFRILCPIGKIDKVAGESAGIIELLRADVGVDVRISDPVAGSDEHVIIISSEEGPDDELFPAQEALLHIQTRIVDLFPDKDNIITTRLLVPSTDIGCLEGKDGPLYEIKKSTGASVQILPKGDLPGSAFTDDELVQIVGEIKSAREALVQVTSILRNHFYREISEKDSPPPPEIEPIPSNSITNREAQGAHDPVTTTQLGIHNVATAHPSKDNGSSGPETGRRNEGESRDDAPSLSRVPAVTLVTRSTLEVIIPESAVPKLIAKSKSKLSQISELSGASVILLEDKPEATTQKVIQISGTPEQAERAQSLLQGFILSTQEDGP
ncbi:RNA-binding KH domain-containing protein RCF3 [Rhodamnia argentea]|uniref:RNA-binding KH domain-containing protein RCF3 n=1 Tax=Rhodamnia argentea TaxID=178133 RepID=A0A8B8QRT8_9MYRT|nr:RNA-binding KH domain-containing protein RCF3 [Rhodamnia argentea]